MNQQMYRVLIVDDDPEMREILSTRLESAGYRIETTASGEECLRMLRGEEERPHLLLLDYKLPGADGLSILDQIQREFPHLPVLFMTAHGSERVAVSAMRRGAYDYLIKPIDMHSLHATIETTITRHRDRLEGLAMLAKNRARLPFEPYEIYVLQKGGGLVLSHKRLKRVSKIDEDLIGGMLQAIRSFIQDSFEADIADRIQTLQHGPLRILIMDGNGFTLVVIGEGEYSAPMVSRMDAVVEELDRRYENMLPTWSGEAATLVDVKSTLSQLIGSETEHEIDKEKEEEEKEEEKEEEEEKEKEEGHGNVKGYGYGSGSGFGNGNGNGNKNGHGRQVG